ncbi:MAG: hypothetical protein H5T50_09070 [Nitrososphaeria archaeon]|nr:hypothetical protein [Nitrososphaeria archaeon]
MSIIEDIIGPVNGFKSISSSFLTNFLSETLTVSVVLLTSLFTKLYLYSMISSTGSLL